MILMREMNKGEVAVEVAEDEGKEVEDEASIGGGEEDNNVDAASCFCCTCCCF